MAVKIEETKPEATKPFVKGDLVQDIKNPQYIYLLSNEDGCGKFLHVSFTVRNANVAVGITAVAYNFNDGKHKLYKGRIILEND